VCVHVTLVHNQKAGGATPSRDELRAEVEALGWRVTIVDKNELDGGLRRPGEVVLVAGGDGTVGKVAKRLAGKDVPVAVIPTGTANNVARALGVGVDPIAAIRALRTAAVRDVDLGVVRNGAADTERFLEGFGVGLFAWVMAERATRKDKKLRRAMSLIADELERYAPKRARVEIDGNDFSGEHLLACVMNLRTLGPALELAPNAEVDDGWLDVVVVRPDHRDNLLAHLRRAAAVGEAPLPHFEVHRAKHVRLSGQGKWAHVDDCSREFAGDVEVAVVPLAAKFLAPPILHREEPRKGCTSLKVPGARTAREAEATRPGQTSDTPSGTKEVV
jgi:diacylglycerol kinase (ATP)